MTMTTMTTSTTTSTIQEYDLHKKYTLCI